jgi:Uncharacterized protein conserved in bacteria
MQIGLVKLKLHAPWVHSLKEKRMIVKSLCAKLRNQLNVSVIEADCQEIHQTIVIAVAFVSGNTALSDSMMEHIIAFTEENCEAQIVGVETELR